MTMKIEALGSNHEDTKIEDTKIPGIGLILALFASRGSALWQCFQRVLMFWLPLEPLESSR